MPKYDASEEDMVLFKKVQIFTVNLNYQESIKDIIDEDILAGLLDKKQKRDIKITNATELSELFE